MNAEKSSELRSRTDLAEQVPFNLAMIDREYNLIDANGNFEEYFGEWRQRKCYEVYKGLSRPCPNCQAMKVFEDGRVRVNDESGHDRHGRDCHYVVHLAPLRNESGAIEYVVEMSTDLTATRRWQREYNLLFERVPCYVAVINREHRIIRANEKFRRAFGEGKDEFCYQVYKRRNKPCEDCPALASFRDGKEHVARQVGRLHDGSAAHYIVSTAPLSKLPDGSAHVIEIATDITEVVTLEDELRKAHDLYASMVHNQDLGIIVLDESDMPTIVNHAAKRILQLQKKPTPSLDQLKAMLPEAFFHRRMENGENAVSKWRELPVRSTDGEQIPTMFRTVELHSQDKRIGRAAFIRDLREIKRLEQEKLDAERLAAVGQTVAGLAHTIKNLLMGLEGGMYMVDTGMRKGDTNRIADGWEVLQTNFEKTTTLVKDFLSFAKGRLPNLKLIDPNEICRSIYYLYKDTAAQQGVQLELDLDETIKPAFLDPEGIEASLTNLLSNGIDAVILRGNDDAKVVIRTLEQDGILVFDVEDNGCGMDWEIKQKIFTTFFTTKGGEGTGLGLLTTRKIIQEHCGKIDVQTKEGLGTCFHVTLPRKMLESLARKTASERGVRKER